MAEGIQRQFPQPPQGGTSENMPMETVEPKAPNIQDEAMQASKDAFEAQMVAEEAVKKAFGLQLRAKEKAQHASQVVVAQSQTANQVAVLAARQAAEEAAKEQKKVAGQQLNQHFVATEAAQRALAAALPYEGVLLNDATANGIVRSDAEQRLLKQQQEQQQLQQQSAAVVKVLLEEASIVVREAQAQMHAARQLSLTTQNPLAQQQANQQAVAAHQQMGLAQEMISAAQSPETALQAAAALSGNKQNQFNQMQLG